MAFGEHWEWRGFGDPAPEIRTRIQQLDKQFGKDDPGMNVLDKYLWVPGSKVNIKIRQKDLKFKYLQEVAANGFEKWKEEEKESYPFPLTMAIVQEMEKALGTSFPEGLLPTRMYLWSLLPLRALKLMA